MIIIYKFRTVRETYADADDKHKWRVTRYWFVIAVLGFIPVFISNVETSYQYIGRDA